MNTFIIAFLAGVFTSMMVEDPEFRKKVIDFLKRIKDYFASLQKPKTEEGK